MINLEAFSPLITHEAIPTYGNGGCCISWQKKEDKKVLV